MHFSEGFQTFVIVREWKITSSGDVGGSFLAVFALAVLYECFKGLHCTLQQRLRNRSYRSTTSVLKTRVHTFIKCRDLVTQFSKTCLFVTELAFAYFLMLVAMTYNTSLFVAVVTGRGVGYFLATPLVNTYIISDKEGSDYRKYRRDSQSTIRKREPLLKGTDI